MLMDVLFPSRYCTLGTAPVKGGMHHHAPDAAPLQQQGSYEMNDLNSFDFERHPHSSSLCGAPLPLRDRMAPARRRAAPQPPSLTPPHHVTLLDWACPWGYRLLTVTSLLAQAARAGNWLATSPRHITVFTVSAGRAASGPGPCTAARLPAPGLPPHPLTHYYPHSFLTPSHSASPRTRTPPSHTTSRHHPVKLVRAQPSQIYVALFVDSTQLEAHYGSFGPL